MKGHIFNLLERFIVETAGAGACEKILDSCEFEGNGVFVRPGNYPDSDLVELVNETVDQLGLTVEQAHLAFGEWIFPHLAKLVPSEMVDVGHPKKFLMTLNEIHEVELKKLWPDAEPPKFYCEDMGPDSMTFTYDSPRQMFDLVDGVLKSVAKYYSVPIRWEKKFREGDAGYRVCQFDLVFEA